MTTKTLSTYAAVGYQLASKYSELVITYSGGVGGFGVAATTAGATIVNDGFVRAANGATGVQLTAGGTVINGYLGGDGPLIQGGAGIYIKNGAGNVTNYGTIRSTHAQGFAVLCANSGTIVNGANTDPAAIIEGYAAVRVLAGSGNVSNFGTILSQGLHEAGVDLQSGGYLLNGGGGDTQASIKGAYGVAMEAAGSVRNLGTIAGSMYAGVGLYFGGGVTNGSAIDTAALIDGYRFGVAVYGASQIANFGTIAGGELARGSAGVVLTAGGPVANGTAIDQSALIEGYTGIYVLGAAATVTNFGTVIGEGVASGQSGVYSRAGGKVTNGSIGDRAARIDGATGVALAALGTVINYGAIDAAISAGVSLGAGGTIMNGIGADRSATISGAYDGVVSNGAAATVKNFGTIEGQGVGVRLAQGGAVTNGSPNNSVALIEGYDGMTLIGAATAANFGTVRGTGDTGGFGVYLYGGASLTNGAAGHAGATIDGYTGIDVYGSVGGTVTNFGTIAGEAGTAVAFSSSTDTLVVEAGSAFAGAVLGGGGTLDLDTGVGTLTGLLSAGGNVTVSGSMATTTFQNFATVEIDVAATFATSGAVTITAGQTVDDAGSLTLGGGKASVVNADLIETTGAGTLTVGSALANGGTLEADGGTLTVSGAVTGKGVAAIDGGTLDPVSSFTQNVTFTGATGILELGQSQTYTGTVFGFSKTGGTQLDLTDIGFASSGEATYSGTKTGGVLTVTDGTHTAHIALKGNYLASTYIAASDGHGGVFIHDPTKGAAVAAPVPGLAPPHAFIAAMAGLGAGGAGFTPFASFSFHAPPMLLAPRSRLA
ncbi:MAG: hypothetical protein ABI306_02780 [Caulobacteraceae bacterium]